MLDTNERFLDNRTELIFVEPYPDALKRAINPTDRIERTAVEA